MFKILLVAPRKDSWSAFYDDLQSLPVTNVDWASSGEKALAAAAGNPPDLAVIDDKLEDMTGLELVHRFLTLNAMINTALVSSLDPEAFHETSEGLGIMAQLPPEPGMAHARELWRRLKGVQSGESVLAL